LESNANVAEFIEDYDINDKLNSFLKFGKNQKKAVEDIIVTSEIIGSLEKLLHVKEKVLESQEKLFGSRDNILDDKIFD